MQRNCFDNTGEVFLQRYSSLERYLCWGVAFSCVCPWLLFAAEEQKLIGQSMVHVYIQTMTVH